MRTNLFRLAYVPLALATLVLTACGGGDSVDPANDEPAATGSTTPDDPTSAAPSETGDLTVPDNPDNGVTSDAILIGWLGDLTGPTASAQTPNHDGIQAYFDYVNSQGGVLGRELQLIAQDDQYNSETLVSNFKTLVDDRRVLALNHVGLTEVVFADVEAAGIPLVGPPQTIDQALENPYMFNLLAHYGDEADVAVARMVDRVGAAEDVTAVVVQLEVPSGDQWNAYVQAELEEIGAGYLGRITMNPGQPDANIVAVQLKQMVENDGLNYVAFHGAPAHAIQLLTAMSDQGVLLPVVGIHGLASNPVYLESPQDALDGVEGIHSFLPGNVDTPGTREMIEAVAGTEYEDDVVYLNFSDGWVDGMVIHQAILRAAEQSGALNRETLTAALRGTFDVGGITCPIDWTESNHSPCAAPFEWTGENLQPVAPFDEWADDIDGEYGLA
jgi:branched-chain amino acid transport system substrate-binding protein